MSKKLQYYVVGASAEIRKTESVYDDLPFHGVRSISAKIELEIVFTGEVSDLWNLGKSEAETCLRSMFLEKSEDIEQLIA